MCDKVLQYVNREVELFFPPTLMTLVTMLELEILRFLTTLCWRSDSLVLSCLERSPASSIFSPSLGQNAHSDCHHQ